MHIPGHNGLARRVAGVVAAISLLLATRGWCADLNAPQVKARYIHGFVKYVTWPEAKTDSTSFWLGVLESDSVKTALDEVVRAKSWQGKPFRTRSLARGDSCDGLQVLYVNEANRDRLAEILQTVSKTTLTIGEGPFFLSRGGMIEFNLSEGKVRFKVNLRALRDNGFTVDSKLLAVAEEVQGR